MKTFVAGATGMLGRHVINSLIAKGHSVRALSRSGAPIAECEIRRGDLLDTNSLSGACDSIEAVISCAGASMSLGNWSDRQSYSEVDEEGNANLLSEALRAGVRKFVYVSLYGAGQLMHTEYASAHERFVQRLRSSGIAYTVIRPTGFFGFLREIRAMAEKNRGVVVGSGTARTNPVHEADVAEACAEALSSEADEIGVGGPKIYSREAVVRAAFASIGRPASIVHIPPAALRWMTAPVKLINPRIHALMSFGVEVSQIDVIAPAYGRKTLEDYLTQPGAT